MTGIIGTPTTIESTMPAIESGSAYKPFPNKLTEEQPYMKHSIITTFQGKRLELQKPQNQPNLIKFKFYIRKEGKLFITYRDGVSLLNAFNKVLNDFPGVAYVNHTELK